MKKTVYFIYVLAFATSFFAIKSIAQSTFPAALKTCETYSQEGGVTHNSGYYKINISLSKEKNKCVYKEKISLGDNWDMLKCEFGMDQMSAISDSMQKFNDVFKNEIAKNPIFSAKMSTNSEIFNTYLANPKYCTILQSKKK